jgi:hypothetical protein
MKNFRKVDMPENRRKPEAPVVAEKKAPAAKRTAPAAKASTGA